MRNRDWEDWFLDWSLTIFVILGVIMIIAVITYLIVIAFLPDKGIDKDLGKKVLSSMGYKNISIGKATKCDLKTGLYSVGSFTPILIGKMIYMQSTPSQYIPDTAKGSYFSVTGIDNSVVSGLLCNTSTGGIVVIFTGVKK